MALEKSSIDEKDAFLLNAHFQIIREKLERIYAVSSKTKFAEEALDEDYRDHNIIAIMGLLGDISSDFNSVYEIEKVLKKVN